MRDYDITLDKLIAPVTVTPTDRMRVELNKKQDHFIISFFNTYYRVDAEGQKLTSAVSPSYEARKFSRRFEDQSALNSKYPTMKISVGCSDVASLILKAWPLSQAEFSIEASVKTLELRQDFENQKKAVELVADYKANGTDPNGKFTVHKKYPLSGYQKVALEAATTAGNYALFMEQGTGKTAPTIARICNEAEKKDNGIYRAIVICPKNVKHNWKHEVEKFSTCQGSVTIIDGSQMNRGKDIFSALLTPKDGDKFHVIVMNYESVKSSMDFFKMAMSMLKENKTLFDLAVLDESHYIKTPGAARSKASHELRDVAKRRMVLTGTPITNNPFDLYMQLEFLGKGMSGFGSAAAFRHAYGVFEAGGQGFEKLVGLQNIPLLQERLARVSFQIRLKEALPDLPDVVNDIYEVEMTKKQEQVYIDLATKMVAEIEQESKTSSQPKAVMAQHILTKLLRLAQVTSGFVGTSAVVDEMTGEELEPKAIIELGENPKINAVLDILKDKGPDDKTIIWAVFVHDVKAISAALTAAGIKNVSYYGATSTVDREAAVKAFNEDPECKVFIGNPAAASTGLNLLGFCPERPEDFTTNCTQIIHFSRNWSADKRLQSDKRAHRRGTRVHVRITDLIVPRTIDTMIMDRVEKKIEMGVEVNDVSEILSEIGMEISLAA